MSPIGQGLQQKEQKEHKRVEENSVFWYSGAVEFTVVMTGCTRSEQAQDRPCSSMKREAGPEAKSFAHCLAIWEGESVFSKNITSGQWTTLQERITY